MRRVLLAAIATQIAMLLALLAQQLVATPATATRGGWSFLVAGLCFVAGLIAWPGAAPGQAHLAYREPSSPEWFEFVSSRLGKAILLTFTLLLAVVAYRQAASNTFTSVGVLAWIGASAAFAAATVQVRPSTVRAVWARLRFPLGFRVRRHHVALLIIFLVAVGFRTYRLASVPAELGSDQAEKLLDVQDVLQGLRPVFFPRNTGREAFQFYLTALLIQTTPLTLSHLALKVGTVLVSLFAIPWTYLLGRELFDRRLGLLAATLMAMSHWHVAISRVGLRFPFTAAFATPTLYFLFRAFRHNRRNDWLAAGFMLGVGLHTYIPMRIVPLLLLVLVVLKAALDWLAWRRGHEPATEVSALRPAFWANAAAGGLLTSLVFLPLFRFMVDQPDVFWMRVTTRSADALAAAGASPLSVFWTNVKNAALMFNVRGDVVAVNTIPYSPVLDWVSGALFVLGLVFMAWRLIRYGDRRALYLAISLFVLLLPSTLSIAFPAENPSVVRTGGAIPVVMIFAALPLWWMTWSFPARFGKPGRLYALVVLIGLLALSWHANSDWYFVRYDRQYRLASWNASDMGRVVRGFADRVGDLDHAYHVAYPHWVDTRAIGINAGDINWYEHAAILDLPAQLPAHESDPAPKLYLLNTADDAGLTALQTQFPAGRLSRFRSDLDASKDFWIFFVPGQP